MITGPMKLVVEEAFVENADVFARQFREVDRGSNRPPASAFANPLGRAGEQDENPVDRVVVGRLGEGFE